ncbi:MAG: hypothetical protein OXE94_01975 [Aestuariivita sp.]|nr:hypothetical protein [Aestuariivita sp.]MCY4203849.1 hypothetical protein [Aestuariivita sp.]
MTSEFHLPSLSIEGFRNDPVLPLAENYINSISEENRKFNDKKRIRAYVHAWLATRQKPRPIGLAITSGDLNKDASNANQFIDWMRKLFKF